MYQTKFFFTLLQHSKKFYNFYFPQKNIMPYFDFHCHPGLKPTFVNHATPISPWTFIKAQLEVFHDLDIGINPLFNEVLNSQCCLSQLYEGDVKLFGIALHSPEANMGRGLLEKKIINHGTIPLLDHDRLELIKDGNHYFQFLEEDLQRLNQCVSPADLNGAKLKIIQNSADFNEADTKTICGFLIVEGLHCFFNDQSAINKKEEFSKNFESFTDANTILAINVCHIQQNPFCNHAYGIQFIKPEYFYPLQSGITAWGKEMISRMMEKKILVDIKHMSLFSRWQLYNLLRDPADENKYIAPIICTHAGITGLSTKDKVKYLFRTPAHVSGVYEVVYLKAKSQHIEGAYYNCSSINLYDEDIEAILLSGGLIGLSFDQRIIGFSDENILRDVTVPHDVEYISDLEANFFFEKNSFELKLWDDDNAVWASEDFANLDPALNVLLHPLFLMNHIIHILFVAKNNPLIGIEKATKQICLGTDYDGLINAVDNCKSVDKLDGFKNFAITKLPSLLQKAGFGNDEIDVNTLVENIFYNNGKNFVINRLKAIGK